MAAQPAIEVTGLEKSFGDLQVLRGVDLLVPPGSVFALLGTNGAGKSTLVRILSTLLRPDAGSARVGGHDTVSAAGQVRQRISLTGQFTAVDDMLTGAENLSMVARLRHLPQPRRIANALLQRFALVEAGNRRVKEYSGGCAGAWTSR